MNSQPPDTQYNAFASEYVKMESLPGEILAALALRNTLTNSHPVSGLRVLDLGGGSGTYARLAVALGAAHVTCVDISAAMVQEGKDIELAAAAAANPEQPYTSKIDYFTSDCSIPLSRTLPSLELASFDLVMGNWVLCYAGTPAELEGMWRNIATYCRPGGSFVGLINMNPLAKSMMGPKPKYGISSDIVGTVAEDGRQYGVKVHITAHTDPLIEFDAFLLERKLYEEMPVKCGMTRVEVSELKEEVLEPGANMEYWKDFFDDPYFHIITAAKERDL